MLKLQCNTEDFSQDSSVKLLEVEIVKYVNLVRKNSEEILHKGTYKSRYTSWFSDGSQILQ